MTNLTIAFQMDPLDAIMPRGDTTFAMMLEAQARGYEIAWFEPNDVICENGAVSATAHTVTVTDAENDYFKTLSTDRRDLRDFDAVFIRQDPPFDIGYVANTQILDLITDDVLVVNDPTGVRDLSEKLAALHFPKLMPDTIVTRDKQAIVSFAAEYEAVVVKRLFLAGGEGVMKVDSAPAILGPTLDQVLADAAPEPIMAQAFLVAAPKGDKRVMFVEGDIVGVLRRVPPPDDFRANIHIGGHAELTTLENDDLPVCNAVRGLLLEHDILFAGIDILDGRLIEINVTSPTLTRELKRLGGPDIPPLIFDAVEARLGLSRR